ncbi:MAG: leucine-rich repeat protein [Oscillospiraceae bacterium]|nr:leucine-rich repeat protein [Oscillospiraceae bacterium]
MKNRILSMLIAIVIIFTTIPSMIVSAEEIGNEVNKGEIVGYFSPGRIPTFEIENEDTWFTDFQVLYTYTERFITLIDPNGYTYTNLNKGNNYISGLIEGTPPENPASSAFIPTGNMRVSGVIRGNTYGLMVENPIFGDIPWRVMVETNSGAISYRFTVFESDYIIIDGKQYLINMISPLDLSNKCLSSFDVSQVRAITGLTDLNVSRNQINDLLPLSNLWKSGLTKLHTLDLSGNPINDLTPLYGIRTIWKNLEIDLRDTNVNLAQIDALKSTLPPNVTVFSNAVCDDCCNACVSCTGICGQPCLHPMCDKIYYCENIPDCSCTKNVYFEGEGWNFFNGKLTVATDGMKAWQESTGSETFKLKDVTEVIIEDGVERVRDYAFGNCTNLMTVSIPNSVEAISYGAFSKCRNLISVTIPNGVTEINGDAFANTGLVSVTIPDSVSTIEVGAFSKTNLASVIIGSGITYMGNSAFGYNPNLNEVRFNSVKPPNYGTRSPFTSVFEYARAIVPLSWGLSEGSNWNGLIVTYTKCEVCDKPSCECPCETCGGFPCECHYKICTLHICSECERICDLHVCDECERICNSHICSDCERTCNLHICEECDRTCDQNICEECGKYSCETCGEFPCKCTLSIIVKGDCIKIKNLSNNAISTKGLYLSNDEELLKWQMPAVIIRPGKYIEIITSSSNSNSVLKRMKTNFDLNYGETLRLTYVNEEVISEVYVDSA